MWSPRRSARGRGTSVTWRDDSGVASAQKTQTKKKSAGLPRLGNSLTDTGSVLQVEETTCAM